MVAAPMADAATKSGTNHRARIYEAVLRDIARGAPRGINGRNQPYSRGTLISKARAILSRMNRKW